MKTLDYIIGVEKEIEVGDELYFGQLWDGDGDGDTLFDSGSISPNGEDVVAFNVISRDEDNIMDSKVKVVDIY